MIDGALMNTDIIDEIIENYQCEASSLIQILLDIQSELHRLPGDALRTVATKRMAI